MISATLDSNFLLALALVGIVLLAFQIGFLRARVAALEERKAEPAANVDTAPSAIPPVPLPPVAGEVGGALSAELLAVITAAVHIACGPECRIAGISPVSTPENVWSLEGRRQIFHSHKVR